MKRILILLMAVIMTFGLCACGGGSTTSEESTPAAEEQTVLDPAAVDQAIAAFLEDEGQEFFTENKDQFEVISGEQISEVVLSKPQWDISKKNDNNSTWEGKYEFETDGDIRETIYDGSVGYFNQRTWSVEGEYIDMGYVVESGEKFDKCQMVRVKEDTYVMYKDDVPHMLMY